MRRRRPWARRNLKSERVGRLVVVRLAPALPSRSPLQPLGRTAWLCRCDCGREVVVATADLTRRRNPTGSCGCAKLRPLAPAAATSPAHQAGALEAVDVPERVTTAQQALDRFHDETSPLGRVRRVCIEFRSTSLNEFLASSVLMLFAASRSECNDSQDRVRSSPTNAVFSLVLPRFNAGLANYSRQGMNGSPGVAQTQASATPGVRISGLLR